MLPVLVSAQRRLRRAPFAAIHPEPRGRGRIVEAARRRGPILRTRRPRRRSELGLVAEALTTRGLPRATMAPRMRSLPSAPSAPRARVARMAGEDSGVISRSSSRRHSAARAPLLGDSAEEDRERRASRSSSCRRSRAGSVIGAARRLDHVHDSASRAAGRPAATSRSVCSSREKTRASARLREDRERAAAALASASASALSSPDTRAPSASICDQDPRNNSGDIAR